MIRVYISAPMTGLPDLNRPAMNAEAARLRSMGFDVVNPAELDIPAGSSWDVCMRADIAALVTCQGVALLPGHEGSRGVALERHIAEQLGMPVTRAEYITHGPGASARAAVSTGLQPAFTETS